MFTFPLSVCGKYRHLIILFLAVLLALSFTFVLGNRYQQTYLLLKVESLQQSSLQVFFDTGEGIEERFNQVRVVPAGNIAHSVRFPVPDKPIYSLRIDPGTDIRIVEISLVDGRNALITRLDATKLVALNDIDDIRKTGEGVLVITKGIDPQLRLVLSPRLPNNYGFNVLFALTLFFISYCILWLASCLFRIILRNLSAGAEGFVVKQSRSWLFGLHLLVIVLGGIAIAGASVLWVCEGRSSLGEDHGKHDLVPYENEISVQSVTFERQPDGLSLAAMLYKARQKGDDQPAVLLLHGNYPQASAFPLYQVMAAELAGRGYVVLAMDFAGYGRSADPFAAGGLESLNLNVDAAAGLQFLRQQPGVDGDHLHVTGHSMGADPAISVGSMTDAVRSIALVGPPRRVYERFNYPPDVDFFWNWALHVRKTVYKKKQFPDWFNKELWRQQILNRDMVHFLPYLSQWSHKPVLFLDGEREIGPDRRFLQWYYCRTSWPKHYVTLNKANHDCNVVARHGRIYYDPAVMDQTVDALDQWFKRAEKKQPQLSDLVLNLLRRLFAVEMVKGC